MSVSDPVIQTGAKTMLFQLFQVCCLDISQRKELLNTVLSKWDINMSTCRMKGIQTARQTSHMKAPFQLSYLRPACH